MAATTNRSVARGARGVTLIELLVAVLILVLMIVAFSRILSQGQVVVSRSQRAIRANAQAAAIAQVLRRDVAAITTDGFLYIGSGDAPALAFTAVGPFTSRIPPSGITDVRANAAVICYSAGDDSSTGTTGKVLCRKTHLLVVPEGAPTWNPNTNDIMMMLLTNVQQNHSGARPNNIILKLGGFAPVATLPGTLDEVKKTWPVLVSDCTQIDVKYRTVNSNGQLDPWSGAARTWSHANRNNWPAVLKMSFKISDTTYEIVCPVAR